MKFARDVMCNMLSYEPTPLLRELLVDLRLLLHKACNPNGSKSGLFIMKTGEIELNVAKRRNMNGTTIDSDNTRIFDDQWKPTNMQYGLNKWSSNCTATRLVMLDHFIWKDNFIRKDHSQFYNNMVFTLIKNYYYYISLHFSKEPFLY